MKELAKVFNKMVDCMLEADGQLQEIKAQRDAIVREIGERRYNLLIKSYNRVLGVFDDAESVSILLSEVSKKQHFRWASDTNRRVPRDMFRRPSRNIMRRDMDKVRPKAIPPNAYDDIPFSGGQHDFYGALHDLVADGLESDQIVRKLTRRFKVKAPFILEQLRRFYGEQMRVASTRRVAGHIVLAKTVNVRQLQRAVEDTLGVDDVEIEDGVLTFFMDKFENKSVEKQIKSLAKKFKVNFQKGDFTNGLGMIETRTASPKRTPNGIWEEFGDTRKREYVDLVPKARAGDVTPRSYDYKSLILELAEAIEPKSNKLYIAMSDGKVKVHLFKKVAEYTETVEVSRGYPDGGASFELYEAYYSYTEGKIIKSYLRVEDLLVAGGSLVGGKILSKSQANNFISATKRNNGEVY